MLGARTCAARRLAFRRVATRRHLRCSAPQRRGPDHPPTALPTRGVLLEDGRRACLRQSARPCGCGEPRAALPTCWVLCRQARRAALRRLAQRRDCRQPPFSTPPHEGRHRADSLLLAQSRGRVAGAAPLRRRAAQGSAGCDSPQGEASSDDCLSTEHRHAPARAGHARASSARARGHRAAQGSRPKGPTAAVKRRTPPARGSAPPNERKRHDTLHPNALHLNNTRLMAGKNSSSISTASIVSVNGAVPRKISPREMSTVLPSVLLMT